MGARTILFTVSTILVVVFLGVLYILTQQLEQNLSHPDGEFGTVIHIGDTPIKVAIADTPEERAKGLSGTLPEPPRSLLFVFETVDTWGIWMKDMQYPIDVLWIDANLRVVYLEENMQPASYPRVYKPDTPVRYVLELPAGFVEIHNLALGDLLRLE
jgi:uncharacterized membrane protein (UPF0127 family)